MLPVKKPKEALSRTFREHIVDYIDWSREGQVDGKNNILEHVRSILVHGNNAEHPSEITPSRASRPFTRL
jgi:hypothetical protein